MPCGVQPAACVVVRRVVSVPVIAAVSVVIVVLVRLGAIGHCSRLARSLLPPFRKNVGQLPRIGLLWRGDRTGGASSGKAEERLGPLIAAFDTLPVTIERVVYADDAVEDVREQLLGCNGVLVWVNPIQDGVKRARLDTLLREVAARGVWVSAHPDTVLKLGTKDVLYRARKLQWGSDVELYRTPGSFTHRFPARLASYGQLVVKQGRGNGGEGVWKVELAPSNGHPDTLGAGAAVLVRDARATDGASVPMQLGHFMALAGECFAWSGCLIDQPFQERLAEGMLRCYFTHDQVVGFCRQWPRRGLLGPEDALAAASGPASVMEPVDAPAYQRLRREAETRWLPELTEVLDLRRDALPVIWDADLLFGPETLTGEDTYVLCEINASAVWPFPPTAALTIAEAAVAAASERLA